LKLQAKLKGDLNLSKTKNNVIKIGNSAKNSNTSTSKLIVEKYLSDNERRREDLLKDKYKENIYKEKTSKRNGASSTIRELILDLRKQRSERFLIPEALFILNSTENKTLIREAIKLQIPIIAVLGSSSNTFGIQYPIPGNTESVQSLNLYTQFIFYAISEAKKNEIKSICS
jgi:ribosomal protein S2